MVKRKTCHADAEGNREYTPYLTIRVLDPVDNVNPINSRFGRIGEIRENVNGRDMSKRNRNPTRVPVPQTLYHYGVANRVRGEVHAFGY